MIGLWRAVALVGRLALLLATIGMVGDTAWAAEVRMRADGSAAVTLDSGLMLMLRPEVVRTVRRAATVGDNGESLQQITRRHAAEAPLRRQAIEALAGTWRNETAASGAHANGGRAGRQATPDGRAASFETDPLDRARPLGASLNGRTPRAATGEAVGTATRAVFDATPARRAPDKVRRNNRQTTHSPARVTDSLWNTPTDARERRPEAGTRADRTRRTAARTTERDASRPVAPVRGGARTAEARFGNTGAPRLGDPTASLLSSSLSTTVIGRDPVASPSGLSLR